MNDYSSLEKCPLFKGLAEKEIVAILDCLNAKTKSYTRGSYVFEAGQKVISIGIVTSGCVNIVQDDFWGNRTILASVGPNDIFGEAFSCADILEMPVSAICVEKSEIMLIDYRKVATTCTSACVFHTKLIGNMISILANKNVMLTKKIEHISKRNTREKILSYLSEQARQNQKSSFTIPFDRQGLADYLAVDRSAMSYVLSKLRDEGIIKYNKNEFELL